MPLLPSPRPPRRPRAPDAPYDGPAPPTSVGVIVQVNYDIVTAFHARYPQRGAKTRLVRWAFEEAINKDLSEKLGLV